VPPWAEGPQHGAAEPQFRFKIQDSKFKIQDSKLRIQNSRFKTPDSKFMIQNSRPEFAETFARKTCQGLQGIIRRKPQPV
jgi:hypothetical protein